jgi:hypothetical protein
VVAHLSPFVPPPGGGVPANSVHVTAATGRPLALGGRRGSEYRIGFPVSALKGAHLEADVRFLVWASSPNDVDNLLEGVHSDLLAAHDLLRALGFLKIEAEGASLAERVEEESAWRGHTEFKVLYEHHFQDSDDAESFLVQIPIRSDLEEENSPEGTTETVIDEMRRWDDEGAAALVVRGGQPSSGRLTGLTSFDFRPGGFVGDAVVVERLIANSAVAPTVFASFDDFVDAVTDPLSPERHATFTFASLNAFLTALGPPGDPFFLGDWDEDAVLDQFIPRRRTFDFPLLLPSARDLFSLRYQAAALPSPGIVYLRALTPTAGPA